MPGLDSGTVQVWPRKESLSYFLQVVKRVIHLSGFDRNCCNGNITLPISVCLFTFISFYIPLFFKKKDFHWYFGLLEIALLRYNILHETSPIIHYILRNKSLALILTWNMFNRRKKCAFGIFVVLFLWAVFTKLGFCQVHVLRTLCLCHHVSLIRSLNCVQFVQ